MDARFDRSAYLARVGVEHPSDSPAEFLRRLHIAHVSAIPFENLDIQMGRPIRLDLASLQHKLVTQLRGGYCFEHNTLFAHALRSFGFDVTLCEARVRLGTSSMSPRTHAALLVRTDGNGYLCDVGFGGDGLMAPLPIDGRIELQHPWPYRVTSEGRSIVLQSYREGQWLDLYAVVGDECDPVDYDVANWYTSTSPESRFVTSLTAQRCLPTERRILRNLGYAVITTAGTTSREVRRDELVPLLQHAFGISLPGETRFTALDGEPMASSGRSRR